MGNLFGSQKPTPPARMPDVNDPAILAAKAKQLAAIQSRSGRSSTELTPNNSGGTGGSQAYKNSVLGQS